MIRTLLVLVSVTCGLGVAQAGAQTKYKVDCSAPAPADLRLHRLWEMQCTSSVPITISSGDSGISSGGPSQSKALVKATLLVGEVRMWTCSRSAAREGQQTITCDVPAKLEMVLADSGRGPRIPPLAAPLAR